LLDALNLQRIELLMVSGRYFFAMLHPKVLRWSRYSFLFLLSLSLTVLPAKSGVGEQPSSNEAANSETADLSGGNSPIAQYPPPQPQTSPQPSPSQPSQAANPEISKRPSANAIIGFIIVLAYGGAWIFHNIDEKRARLRRRKNNTGTWSKRSYGGGNNLGGSGF